jgi:hypothetical protein
MIKLFAIITALIFASIQFGCSPAKPSDTTIIENIKNTVQHQSERYASHRSIQSLLASMSSMKVNGVLSDTLLGVVLIDGVLQKVNAVPTYKTNFKTIVQYKKGDSFVLYDTFPGEATFEKYEKGWKLTKYY